MVGFPKSGHIFTLAIIPYCTLLVCRLKQMCNPACKITMGALFTSCNCEMKHVRNVTCAMCNVICGMCVYAIIFYTFQLIGTLQTRTKIKGEQGNHHGAMDMSSSNNKTAVKRWQSLWCEKLESYVDLVQPGLTAGRPSVRWNYCCFEKIKVV